MAKTSTHVSQKRLSREFAEKSMLAEAALRIARIRGGLALREINELSGPAISTTMAGARLRRTAETVRHMIERGDLIGFRPFKHRTTLLLPLWQFTSRGGVQPWVADLIKAYRANGWSLVNFLVAPRSNLDGKTYLHRLQNGASAEVVRAAKRTNPD